MLAHKASYEAKLAAEVCAGHDVSYHAWTIPSVAYTDPEIAWAGHTETSALAASMPFQVARFPWAGNGRNLGIGRSDGLTKILFDPGTGRILGAAITGKNAGELIAEAVVAMEMCATIEDISLIIHPHPTLAETLAMAAEIALGSCVEASPTRKTGT
jgi:dihydrolipoamide dehydrogenase